MLNLLLACGLLLIFTGVLTILYFAQDAEHPLPFNAFDVVLSFIGLGFLFVYIAIKRSAFCLFVSLSLILNSLFCMIVSLKIIKLTLNELWPGIMIITGLSLFIAGKTRGFRLSLSYDFPSIMLVCLGVNYLLFSLDIIKQPLTHIVLVSAPVILILSGVFLLILFYKRKEIIKVFPKDSELESAEEGEAEKGKSAF